MSLLRPAQRGYEGWSLLRDVLIGIGIAIALITGGCEGMRPRYDAQGNGTRLGDKIERWLVHTVNQEHY